MASSSESGMECPNRRLRSMAYRERQTTIYVLISNAMEEAAAVCFRSPVADSNLAIDTFLKHLAKNDVELVWNPHATY